MKILVCLPVFLFSLILSGTSFAASAGCDSELQPIRVASPLRTAMQTAAQGRMQPADIGGQECQTADDCPLGDSCQEGACWVEGSCSTDMDCSSNFHCDNFGTCQPY